MVCDMFCSPLTNAFSQRTMPAASSTREWPAMWAGNSPTSSAGPKLHARSFEWARYR